MSSTSLSRGTLGVEKLGRGYCWFDTGTHDSLLSASAFIHSVQSRQGLRIACLEEIAFQNGWIDAEQLLRLAEPMASNDYGRYLIELADDSGD